MLSDGTRGSWCNSAREREAKKSNHISDPWIEFGCVLCVCVLGLNWSGDLLFCSQYS